MNQPSLLERIQAYQHRYAVSSGDIPINIIYSNPTAPLVAPRNKKNFVLETLLKPEDGLLENSKWCWANPVIPQINAIGFDLDALEFSREFVCKNTPCVITGMIDMQQQQRSIPQLLKMLGNKPVRVNCTPNGRADSVMEHPDTGIKVFAMPEEREMPFREFATWLLTPQQQKGEVFYISAQNDSLRSEYAELFADEEFTPTHIQQFATKQFGKSPDAVNLWIGDSRSVSTMHHDTYENMYCCLSGTKIFHLLPPCALPFMNQRDFPNAMWQSQDGKLKLVEGTTPWIELDIITEGEAWLPELVRSMIQRVELRAGQCLYLPSGWLHRVTQTEPTVAVNFWYDRDLNATWALMEALQQVIDAAAET